MREQSAAQVAHRQVGHQSWARGGTVALGKLARQRAPPSATLLPTASSPHMSHGHDIGRVCVRVVINKQTDKPAASEHNRVLQDTTQLLTDC